MARPLILFYILVIYVLLQFSWWAFLLIELYGDISELRIELLELKLNKSNDLQFQKAEQEIELKKRKAMILGEGSVFLGLLLVGIYITNHAFRKESELARQQRNFLLSVTHEFKSPLAAVKLNLQTLEKRQLEREQQEDVLRKAIMEADRLDTLVEKALLAARLEDKSFDLETEKINLSELVHRIISDHVDRREPRQAIIHHIEPSIYIKGDQIAFTSLLSNLIENAEKYSPPDSTIEVSLVTDESQVLLRVSDTGLGIAPGERKNVFEKFYRIGNEDTRKTKGTGLGLYIVRNIVQLHKGNINVRDNDPKGTVFEMTFPRTT